MTLPREYLGLMKATMQADHRVVLRGLSQDVASRLPLGSTPPDDLILAVYEDPSSQEAVHRRFTSRYGAQFSPLASYTIEAAAWRGRCPWRVGISRIGIDTVIV